MRKTPTIWLYYLARTQRKQKNFLSESQNNQTGYQWYIKTYQDLYEMFESNGKVTLAQRLLTF
jgi:hypothetical protein